ncbi:MAG: host-nuclease inhibitor Gam family protein [Azonexus sp.]|jgi:phage host-nuclease inhibitor protein Gam|nr:host-nuclease inhibitor Gam family protein [Azonexus sp.]
MATAKPKTRIKTAAAPVETPQTREQAAQKIARIGELSREITRIHADMNDQLAVVKERFEADAQPLKDQVDALTAGVQIWAEANRDALTQNGKVKTAALTTGEIAWRLRPPSVRVTGAEAVLDLLRRLGLSRFIREKSEVNKDAILNEPEAVASVPGLAIIQGEDFVVTPFEAELAQGGA